MNSDRKCFTINELANMEILGEHYSYQCIRRLINKNGIKQARNDGFRGSKKYNIDDIEPIIRKFAAEKSNKPAPKDDINELKAEKINHEIERLKQEKERAYLEISKLKQTLIDASEVKDYLMLRYATENAILRQILLVNAPIELTGIDIPKARKICESYFNKIQIVMNETLLIWQQRNVDLDKDVELPQRMRDIIQSLNDAVESNKIDNNDTKNNNGDATV